MEVYSRAKLLVLQEDLTNFFNLVLTRHQELGDDQLLHLLKDLNLNLFELAERKSREDFLDLIMERLTVEKIAATFNELNPGKISNKNYERLIEKFFSAGEIFRANNFLKNYLSKLLETKNTPKLKELDEKYPLIKDVKENVELLYALYSGSPFEESLLLETPVTYELINSIESNASFWIYQQSIRNLLFENVSNFMTPKVLKLTLKALMIEILENGVPESKSELINVLNLKKDVNNYDENDKGLDLFEGESSNDPILKINLLLKLNQNTQAMEVLIKNKGELDIDEFEKIRQKILGITEKEAVSENAENIIKSLVLDIKKQGKKITKKKFDEGLSIGKSLRYLDNTTIRDFYKDLIFTCVSFEKYDTALELLNRANRVKEIPEVEFVYLKAELLRFRGKLNEALDLLNNFIHKKPFLKNEARSIYKLQKSILSDLGLTKSVKTTEKKIRSITKE